MRSPLLTIAALAAVLTGSSALADSPSASSIATHASMRGSLNGGMRVVPVQYDDGSWAPLDGMARESLLLERNRIEDSRPGIGVPIALIAVGGGLMFAGFITAYVGLIALYTSSNVAGVILGIGGAIFAGGSVMLVIGIIRLVATIRERRIYSDRLDEINRRLEQLDQGPNMNPYIPAPPPPPLGMPPPPPPAAQGNVPDASMLIASF